MKGDFTRKTFDPKKHYSRVLMQQGRVTLDADPNEQTDILLHYLRTLAEDLIGPYAGPAAGGGFDLAADEDGKLLIGEGRYYVDGILVENEAPCHYSTQPSYPIGEDDPLLREMQEPQGKLFWVYLDVWERHITFVDDARIRETALGGPDTCSRSRVIWQVKAREMEREDASPSNAAEKARLKAERMAVLKAIERTDSPDQVAELKAKLEKLDKRLAELDDADGIPDCASPLDGLVALSDASMAARVDPGEVSKDPCALSPEAKYRGTENHLYRVEIHEGGAAGKATFKWSRDNGSVVSAWLGAEGNDLRVASGRGFSAGKWVELLDAHDELLGRPGTLVKLAGVEGDILLVDAASVPSADALAWSGQLVSPRVRLWDQRQAGDIVLVNGAVPVEESNATAPNWIALEDGIQIEFAPGGNYRSGDYWLIPARVATGDIEWHEDDSGPAMVRPHGIQHHFAPLGFLIWEDNELQLKSCICEFDPLSNCLAKKVRPAPGERRRLVLAPLRMSGLATPARAPKMKPAKKTARTRGRKTTRKRKAPTKEPNA